MIKIISLPLGLYETNCYILINKDKAIVIDPADNAPIIKKVIAGKNAKLDKILLTHGHLDHVLACAELQKESGAEVFIHEADFHMVSDIKAAYPQDPALLTDFIPLIKAVFIKEGDRIKFGDIIIDIIETPGHTNGSVMYAMHSEKMIFTGDTVFYLTIGNCGTNADFIRLINSVKKLNALTGDYTLYTGHGQETSLSFEKANNRYL